MPPKIKPRSSSSSSKLGSSGGVMISTHEGFLGWTKRKRRCMNPVMNQGRSSYCSIITGVAAVECLFMIGRDVENVKFSEQEIIDNFYFYYEPSLENPLGKYGTVNKCFKYIKEYGISRNEDWPFTGIKAEPKEPRPKPNPQTAIYIEGYTEVLGGEEFVLAALEIQPLAGALYVSYELMELKRPAARLLLQLQLLNLIL